MSFDFRPIMSSAKFETKQVMNNGRGGGNTGYHQKKKQNEEELQINSQKDECDVVFLEEEIPLKANSKSKEKFSITKFFDKLADKILAKATKKPNNPFQNC